MSSIMYEAKTHDEPVLSSGWSSHSIQGNYHKVKKVSVAVPMPKHLLYSWWSLLCNVTKSLKETVADPTWILSTIATIHSVW